MLTSPNFMPPGGAVYVPNHPEITWGGPNMGWRYNGQPLPESMASLTLGAVGAPGTFMEGARYTGQNGVWDIPDRPAAQLVPAGGGAPANYGAPQYMQPHYPTGSGYGVLGMPSGGAVVLDLVSFGKLAAKLYTAFVSLPPPPAKTEDTQTDVNNQTKYVEALARHEQRSNQIVTVVESLGELLRPRQSGQ